MTGTVKLKHVGILACIMITAAVITTVQSKPLPIKDSVSAKMVFVNKHFFQKWPVAGQNNFDNANHATNIWTRATYMEGLMALNRTKPDTAYYNYAVRWGTFHNWTMQGGNTGTNADNQCCGQAYIELYQLDTTQTARISNITTCMTNMKNNTAVNYWTWVDAIHMAMPVLAKVGVLRNDTSFFTKMYNMYNYTKVTIKCYDTTTHLWFRDANFVPPVAAAYRTPNGLNCYWSRGNGWVMMALVRVLDVLPATDSHRAEYIKIVQEMAAALKPIQRADGFWNVDLGDSTNYPGPEITGTSMFTYGIAWGINHGILDSATYKPVVTRAWNAMMDSCIHPLSDAVILGFVQGSGDRPASSQPVTYAKQPNFDDYAVGAVLLAGSEVYKLAPTTPVAVVVPAIPTLIAPANAAVNVAVKPTFTWSNVSEADSYRVQVSTASAFSVLAVDDSTRVGNTVTLGTSLNSTTKYYWRVNAKNTAGTSSWSGIFSFTTGVPVPAVPALVSPSTGTVLGVRSASLTWGTVTGATSYRIQVSTISTFATLSVDDSTLQTSTRTITSLSDGTYYWRVNAKNTGGTSAWTSLFNFRISVVGIAMAIPHYVSGALGHNGVFEVYMANGSRVMEQAFDASATKSQLINAATKTLAQGYYTYRIRSVDAKIEITGKLVK